MLRMTSRPKIKAAKKRKKRYLKVLSFEKWSLLKKDNIKSVEESSANMVKLLPADGEEQ